MLLEIEAGYAKNEPVTFAVRKAIEAGVVELIKRGVEKDLWKYKEIIEAEDVEITEEVLGIDESTIVDETIHGDDEIIHERIIWDDLIDENTSEERTYQEYLIEQDAGIHSNNTNIIITTAKEESADEENNENSAIVPNKNTYLFYFAN